MGTRDIMKFTVRRQIWRSDAEAANANPLDEIDGWFVPALLVGIMLILVGSVCLIGN